MLGSDDSKATPAFARFRLTLAWLFLLAGAALIALACDPPHEHDPTEVSGSDCATCHHTDFEAAVQPLHVQQLPLDCESCHSYEAWAPASGSDHQAFFPLVDAHAEAGCGDCHEANFEPNTMPTTCDGCHMDDYENAGHPSHAGLPTACADCHTEKHFAPSIFEHAWPLAGHHAQTSCERCHTGDPPRYAGTPDECVSCHLQDFENARNPDHTDFSRDCAMCHNPGGFRGAGAGAAGGPNFVHPWPLEGEHATAACNGCHVGDPPRYAGTPRDCIACHQEDFDNAQNPSHDGFSTDCSSCHKPTGWDSAMVDPSDPNFVHPWPLLGAHGSAVCASCHLGDPPVYAGTPTRCVDCHEQDRDAAQPPHDGFSTDCGSCHNEQAFKPASFNHPWPLTGAHDNASCQSCHVGDPPRYAGTPTDCVSCHQADYDSSPFPGHDAFPTTCADCHSTTAWQPASGGHPENRFPTSGRHNYQCNECHNQALGPNSRDNTDCVGCHVGAHTRARMDNEHNGIRNYPSGNAAANFCLNCHPNGSE